MPAEALRPRDFANTVRHGIELFQPDGLRIHHNGSEPKMLAIVLGEHSDYTIFFDNLGRFSPEEFEPIDVFGSTREVLKEQLERRLTPYYDMVEDSHDESYEFGFNRHGIDHVREVTSKAVDLLVSLGASEEEIRIAIVQGYLHDAGMLVSRKAHPFVTKKIIDHLVPELKSMPGFRRQILRGIALHDEKFAAAHMNRIWQKHADTQAAYSEIFNYFGRPSLAILAGDKADAVEIKRITSKKCDHLGKEQLLTDVDEHYQVAAMIEETTFLAEDEGLVLELNFKPGQMDEHFKNILGITDSRNNTRKKLTKELHNLHRFEGVPHLLSWLSLYAKLMKDRVLVMSQALFALKPEMEQFVVRVKDNSDFDDENGGMQLELVIRRDQIQEASLMLDQLALKEENTVNEKGEEVKKPVVSQVLYDACEYYRAVLDKLNCNGLEDQERFDAIAFEGGFRMGIQVNQNNLDYTLDYLGVLFRPKHERNGHAF